MNKERKIDMKRRIFAILLTVIMLMAMFSGCQDAKTDDKKTGDGELACRVDGYPIVDEPVTLDVGMWRHASTADFDDLIVFKKYEELSNVDINWIESPQSGFAERRNIAFATGDLPDAYFKASMSATDIMKYKDSLVPFTPYLETYAPNLNAYLKDNEAVNQGVTMPDGNIYGAPYILESSAIRVQARMFFDNVLMENVGGKMPETTDEFVDYLKLIRDNDANGNGDPNDEIPLVSSSLDHMLQMTAGSFGLNTNGMSHRFVDMPDDKEFRFIPTTDGMREQLKFFRTLYEEKLIDQEIFTMTSTNALAAVSQYQAGAVIWWSVSFIANTDDYYRYTPMDPVLKGPNGDDMFSCVIGAVNSPAAFVVTSACDVPEIAIRWIDYFYSEEGIMLYLLGEEGDTYEMGDNGIPYFTDKIMNNPEGLSFQESYGKYCPQAGGGNPTILTETHYVSGEGLPKSREASDAIKDKIVPFEDVWENFIYTAAESEVMSSLSTDIKNYFNESVARFVSGDLDINDDKAWQDYCAEYDNLGLEDYLTMYQIGYDRYMGK